MTAVIVSPRSCWDSHPSASLTLFLLLSMQTRNRMELVLLSVLLGLVSTASPTIQIFTQNFYARTSETFYARFEILASQWFFKITFKFIFLNWFCCFTCKLRTDFAPASSLSFPRSDSGCKQQQQPFMLTLYSSSCLELQFHPSQLRLCLQRQ